MRFATALVISLVLVSVLQAQNEEPELEIRKNKLVSATSLYPFGSCEIVNFSGLVTSVKNTGEWVELNVRTSKGIKKPSLWFSNRATMSYVFPFLRQKNRKIFFEGYVCGSGGFLYVNGIR